MKSLKVVDLNGDQRDDLLLFGADKFAVLFAGGTAPALKELASFESQLDKVYPTDVLAGWTAGLVWALICWSTARFLQRQAL